MLLNYNKKRKIIANAHTQTLINHKKKHCSGKIKQKENHYMTPLSLSFCCNSNKKRSLSSWSTLAFDFSQWESLGLSARTCMHTSVSAVCERMDTSRVLLWPIFWNWYSKTVCDAVRIYRRSWLCWKYKRNEIQKSKTTTTPFARKISVRIKWTNERTTKEKPYFFYSNTQKSMIWHSFSQRNDSSNQIILYTKSNVLYIFINFHI